MGLPYLYVLPIIKFTKYYSIDEWNFEEQDM
jgi:hypothetical protein